MCKLEGCERKSTCKGYCKVHYEQSRLGKEPYLLPRQIHKVCQLAGCGKYPHGEGYCDLHYHQFKKGIEPYIIKEKQSVYCMGIGCTDKSKANSLCARHYMRDQRHGSPQIVKQVRASCEKSDWSELTNIGYSAAHYRVETLWGGPASIYDCSTGCGRQAKDYAYDHEDILNEKTDSMGRTFTANPEHYKPMCKNCHKKYDNQYALENYQDISRQYA